MKKMLRNPFVLSTAAVVLAVSTIGFGQVKAGDQTYKKSDPEIKNVIFMIGDGMGPAYMNAYRYMKDNPKTTKMEKTEFDKYYVGAQMTYANDAEENITDSASAATAMSTGKKTYNSAIAVDVHKKELTTVLEVAKKRGKATGLVATSQITHATPASYGAHDESRRNENQIADDYFDERIKGEHKIDVMLGGGTVFFNRTDRNLVEEFKKDGYSYVTNKNELRKDKNGQVLGLFADKGLDKAIDRSAEVPDLADMTKEAIKRLNQDEDGFFLMVEGSQIDWAGHDNDIVGAMSEMEDFEKAFKAAINFAKKDRNTLVVLTADHSTGGLTIGANGEYNFFTEPIKAAKHTPDYMTKQILAGKDVEETLKENIALELTEKEIESVKEATKSKDFYTIDDSIEAIFSARSFTGWTTSGHTGEDVPVYAYGPGKERFTGLIDNTDQAKHIFQILKRGR
ncbi:alkaline phosphatase [Hazenella sp. IB182357]|uniref:Alkaline phosphatase n=1 Tax=Polycladospora coralii TaxID=2771432 RepID=A0A926N7A9_9BACL|nr:alkaline phosphatase [Polycladospora coralii]MBD1370748.1 alkaline phosphatase [Polycladospora coralii]